MKTKLSSQPLRQCTSALKNMWCWNIEEILWLLFVIVSITEVFYNRAIMVLSAQLNKDFQETFPVTETALFI